MNIQSLFNIPADEPVGSPAGNPGETLVPETRRRSAPKLPTTTISPEMATRIERWSIDRLVPYDKNARTHSPEQIRKLAASITEFGFTNPILVDNDTGIIAGHARLAAARELNLPEVPVIVLSHLSPAQKRAYILADNRLALDAGWNEDLLRDELQALDDQGYDLDLVGFDADELKALLAEEPRYGEEDESPPLEAAAISRPGDLWILGSHRILRWWFRSRAGWNRSAAPAPLRSPLASESVPGLRGDSKCLRRFGGPGEIRTHDLFHAI
jgi:ParB-like nuclease domain